jgi:hypothetical protein
VRQEHPKLVVGPVQSVLPPGFGRHLQLVHMRGLVALPGVPVGLPVGQVHEAADQAAAGQQRDEGAHTG